MIKKKSILPQVLGLWGVLTSIIILTGCNSNSIDLRGSQPLGDIAFHGDNYFMTSEILNLTNQEMLDLLLVQEYTPVTALINLADQILLRGNFEINEANTIGLLNELRQHIPDFESWLLYQGFRDESEAIRSLELYELRRSFALRTVEVSAADERAAFDEMNLDDFSFAELRNEIHQYLFLRGMFEELAHLRYQANFEIFHEHLASEYRNVLENLDVGVILPEADAPPAPSVIARINNIDITIGHLFHVLTTDLGLTVAVATIDELLLEGMSIEDLFEPTEERLRELHTQVEPSASGRHILVDDFDFAASLITQLQHDLDPATLFSELAIAHSQCPTGQRGGDLGTWQICNTPRSGCMVAEFDEAVLALEVGTFTFIPVETQFGFHIIYKTGFEDVPSFNSMRDDLREEEIARLNADPFFIQNHFATMRQEIGITFTNPLLQARYHLFYDSQ